MMSPAVLFWGMLFSAIGVGYFMYGKKQMHWPALAAGLALIVYPYFVPNVWWLVGIGAMLTLLPWWWR
ncbi:MAG: hypothetical protein WB784_02115 [Rhodanobacteraceae bacterium]